jgi:hypothetical protein
MSGRSTRGGCFLDVVHTVGANFLIPINRDHLPAQHEPLDDRDRLDTRVSTQHSLGSKLNQPLPKLALETHIWSMQRTRSGYMVTRVELSHSAGDKEEITYDDGPP